MKISFTPLKPSDIEEINRQNTLYICDFRALGESLEYEIPAMWKYENLAPWIVNSSLVAVNEDHSDLKFKSKNRFLISTKDSSPKTSVIDRIVNQESISGLTISSVYTFVPHPRIDSISKDKHLNLNYSFSSFKNYNNKISQKKLFTKNTPDWEVVNKKKFINYKEPNKFLLKRSYGSGGYSIVKPSETPSSDIDFENYEWYMEEIVKGDPMSIQCYKKNDEYVIFGFCAQLIENNLNFVGGKVLDYEGTLKNRHLLEIVQEFIYSIDTLISDYSGFLGIDFMNNKLNKQINFLEANVRLTAMTIPTLLTNEFNSSLGSVFHEDVPVTNIPPTDNWTIAFDKYNNTYDLLEFI